MRKNMKYFYIGIFGALGALTRYYIGIHFAYDMFPYHTLMINLLGCFLLACLVTYFVEVPWMSRDLFLGMGTGFMGSFTTFSAFSVETINLFLSNEIFLGTAYILGSLVGGFVAAGMGVLIAKELQRIKEV